jgi:hypothetical protein
MIAASGLWALSHFPADAEKPVTPAGLQLALRSIL